MKLCVERTELLLCMKQVYTNDEKVNNNDSLTRQLAEH